MKLFRLWPAVYANKHDKNQDCPFKPWYYTTIEVIVCASSEEEARRIVQTEATTEEWQECDSDQESPCKEPWLYEKYTKCQEIALNESKVISRWYDQP